MQYTDAGENVTNRDWLTNALRKLGMNEDKRQAVHAQPGEPAGAVL